jgi:hypothetical protein
VVAWGCISVVVSSIPELTKNDQTQHQKA